MTTPLPPTPPAPNSEGAKGEAGAAAPDKAELLRDLRWRIAANADRGRPRAPRWTHVSAVTAFGSGKSIALCIGAGFDPDEIVGDDPNDEETP